MGTKLIVAAVMVTLVVGGPAFLPSLGNASAQGAGCTCSAALDAVDSDLQNIGRRYNKATLGVPAEQCAAACNSWRRDWFYRDACDKPTRINRGTRASWGFESGRSETFVGPDTWWCPMPPP
jgi:hypothetical protein